MNSVIDSFLPSWHHARGLTLDFVRAVPDDRWKWSPNPRYAPLNKQFRHMICVEGVYIGGLLNRSTDFGEKHSHYLGTLDREPIIDGLISMDQNLEVALDKLRGLEDEITIEFYGRPNLATYLNTFLYHEALHQGQWSFYATLGGFNAPESWRLNWGL